MRNQLQGAAEPAGSTVACAVPAERPIEGRDLSAETEIEGGEAELSDEEDAGAIKEEKVIAKEP